MVVKMRHSFQSAVVAEWLRRLTRNQMGYARAGSNPAACGIFFDIEFEIFKKTMAGLTKKAFFIFQVSYTFSFEISS